MNTEVSWSGQHRLLQARRETVLRDWSGEFVSLPTLEETHYWSHLEQLFDATKHGIDLLLAAEPPFSEDSEGTGERSGEPERGDGERRPSDCHTATYHQVLEAWKTRPHLTGDLRATYNWLAEHSDASYQLPKLETFRRYFNQSRRYHEGPQRSGRQGRAHGRSVAHSEDL